MDSVWTGWVDKVVSDLDKIFCFEKIAIIHKFHQLRVMFKSAKMIVLVTLEKYYVFLTTSYLGFPSSFPLHKS